MSNIPTFKNNLKSLGSNLNVLKEKAGTTKRLVGGRWALARNRVMQRDYYTCQICGHVDTRNEVDHVIPLEQGGSNDDSNLQTLCHSCHAIKTAREQRKRYGKE